MTDTLKTRRVKLGMTIQPKKKTPYDELSEKMLAGGEEESNLEQQGARNLRGRNRAAARAQRRLPKAKPGSKAETYL